METHKQLQLLILQRAKAICYVVTMYVESQVQVEMIVKRGILVCSMQLQRKVITSYTCIDNYKFCTHSHLFVCDYIL